MNPCYHADQIFFFFWKLEDKTFSTVTLLLFVWLLNLIAYIKWGTQAEGVQEKGADKDFGW
jgi:hypothetical protein